jgi:hypothetical protein
MARKRKERVPAYPARWPDHVSIADLRHFVARESLANISAFEVAHDLKDDAGMIAAHKKLRGMVDKVDAFRRLKLRAWADESEVQSKAGEVTT